MTSGHYWCIPLRSQRLQSEYRTTGQQHLPEECMFLISSSICFFVLPFPLSAGILLFFLQNMHSIINIINPTKIKPIPIILIIILSKPHIRKSSIKPFISIIFIIYFSHRCIWRNIFSSKSLSNNCSPRYKHI